MLRSPFIFISCGQYTEAERSLGKTIKKMVESVTGRDAFFAEEVQDLNGLDVNILAALRDCAAFVTVLHPRGEITRPDGTELVRASVWIEQEIAIATYIQRVEKRPLPVIAFIHESVGREGIRDLLHLNPIAFSDESDVLAALPKLLSGWTGLTSPGIRVQLRSVNRRPQDNHWVCTLEVSIINDTSQRIADFDCEVRLPIGILKHWSMTYPSEDRSPRNDPHNRYFRFTEKHNGPIHPHGTHRLTAFDYCTQCAGEAAGGIGALVAEATVKATVWFDNREYTDEKTIQELSEKRDARD